VVALEDRLKVKRVKVCRKNAMNEAVYLVDSISETKSRLVPANDVIVAHRVQANDDSFETD
jgi:hypothetical protein